MRLARWMALSGLCSRREAERWILLGRVCVNDTVILTPAYTVTAQDHVIVDGVRAEAPEKPRLWCYYKPVGVMTTHRDPEGRPTVFAQLPSSMPRVISAGRLDLNSEGLLVLTNDGALARFLEHPAQGFKRTYRVRVYGTVSQTHLDQLTRGITVEGMRYRPIQVMQDKRRSSREASRNQWLILTLEEGKNREIRKVMHALGLDVNRLIRTDYGPFSLNNLKPGEVKEVTVWPKILKNDRVFLQ